MNVKEVETKTLVIPKYCNRYHSPDQVDRFIKEYRVHDQYQPIVVSGNEILCGALIYLAFRKLGKETCFVNDLGPLSLEKKKEIRYLDNQIFDIESWEEEEVKLFLMSLDVSELDKVGFSVEETELFVNSEPEIKLQATKSLRWKDQWECESCGWKGTLNE